MKVTARNIKLINKRLNYLCEHFDILGQEVKIGDKDIIIDFPKDYGLSYSVEDFLCYTDKLENIKIIGNHSVICGTIRQTIINIYHDDYNCLIPKIKFEINGISLRIVDNPFLIGIISSRDGKYDKYSGISPCSIYTAIEVLYKKDVDPNEERDIELIKRCLFYIASKYKISISIGTFVPVNDYVYEENEVGIVDEVVTQNELLSYCSAMDYYVESLSINRPDIKYLHFYKIIEYFSPTVAKKTSYEQLNKRLDALRIVERDSEYLESIFKLTKQYEVSLKDKELTSTVLRECVDIVLLFPFLPQNIQRSISKSCHLKGGKIVILDSSNIQAIIKELGDILYATRNSIVHAKSNYNLTEKECSEEDLEQLNEFMAKLCECLFIWNARQSSEFRVK